MVLRTFAIAACVLLSPLSALAQINPGAATTVQLPTFGVAIDAEGVLSTKTFPGLNRQQLEAKLAAAKQQAGGNAFAKSPLRQISLVRLEAALAKQVADGKQPDDVIRRLAGLQRIQYVMLSPDKQDIIIAGPAEGWLEDGAGRAVGIRSGAAVIELDDLAAALRTFPPNSRERPFVGCTIDPDPKCLAVGSSRVDLQACKLEYSIVSPK